MKTLATHFTKSGGAAVSYDVEYWQVARMGQVAVYERVAPGWRDFETVVIRENEAGSMKVKKDGVETTVQFEAKETYPSSESWGTHGFTYGTKAAALAKMSELLTPLATGKQS